MDASGADKLILLVQTNQVLYDKSAAYKVKDALEKGDIWQIGIDISVNSERTLPFIVSRFSVALWPLRPISRFSFLVPRFSFLVSRFSFLVSRWRCDWALKLYYDLNWPNLEIVCSRYLLGCYCHPNYVCHLVWFIIHANLSSRAFRC